MRTITYAELTPADFEGVKWWDHRDAERLQYTGLDEAIEAHLDNMDPEWFADPDRVLEFEGFVPMPFDPKGDDEWVLEFLLERWNEDFGDPENAYVPNDAMKVAASEFVAKVRAEFVVWACEPIIRVSVPVRAWVEKHAPEWLKES